ncbi:Low-molecular weight cobalt-containing nitrile hydratase subunit beta [Defluviimonas aquaemixtae]|uniref:Nitrile hydratase subunit beta n=1 Tax=Albidovulum aquaemixtae TaxID=1542388 RepID=A0A2R8B7S8_9RHOB|nr:nitrile hydratase subunit beta [Defluviimonas aquaemixtae]SPH18636.1 Low-molecular weight cobalt-containing nitrile hydratase subunit beta [Defluviimonas aquaemixtae]
MTRVHDMGGRYGDGPVLPEPRDAAPFAEDWHRRALALTLAAGGLGAWSIDASRRARESLPPKDYARFTYYEKWMAALADLLVDHGFVTREELASGTAASQPLSPLAVRADAIAPALAKRVPYARQGPASAFAAGDKVRARLPARNAFVPGGHTRLPAYAAGQIGRVVLAHGAHVLPDSNAHGLGEAPEPLYTVAFDAAALWGAAEREGDEVTLDLWESYLERA